MSIDPYIARLKKRGHRVTPKVRAVLELFLKCGCVLDPLEVRSRLQKQFKDVGLPAIYRILESLAPCGILLPAANEDRQRAQNNFARMGDAGLALIQAGQRPFVSFRR